MGVYVYTLRAREITLRLPGEETEKARLFSFAYKPYWTTPTKDARRREARCDATADHAFASYTGGLVIEGDLEKGLAGLDGAYVYRNATRPRWSDCNPFPGTPAGIVQVRDGKAYLTDSGPWQEIHTGDTVVMRRIVLKDGRFQEENQTPEPTTEHAT